MSFCSDCGKELPDNAVFCPNCGRRSDSAPKTPAENDKENCDTQQQYMEDSQSPDSKESREQYTVDNSNSYEHDTQPQTNPVLEYNLDPNIYKSSSTTESAQKSSSKKTAAIVVCTVLALLITAAMLILSLSKKSSEFIGYWESTDGYLEDNFYLPDMYGESVQGHIAIQIEKNHDIYLVSPFEDNVISGNWEKTDTGLEAEIYDDYLDFVYSKKDNTLSLIGEDGYSIVFERAEGNIYDTDANEDSSSYMDDSILDDEADNPTNEISGSGYLGNDSYYISVIGAEQFSDVDGSSAIRVFFEFSNNSDHNASVQSTLEYYAKQDGKKLDDTYTWDDVDVYGNTDRYIRPGVMIQCCYEFKYNTKGGSVDFIMFDYDLGTEGGSVAASYNPGELPGPPANFTIETIAEPNWAISLPSEGNLDEDYYVAVTDAELIYDYYGDAAIRVYYEFTNNSNYEQVFAYSLNAYAYQDGISLDWAYPTVNSETDDNYYEQVNPGETINASCVFLLRNDSSPVEAEIMSLYSYNAVAQTYDIS